MTGRRLLLIWLLLLAATLRVGAQDFELDERFNKVHKARVKTLNEFIHRFNAQEVPDFVRSADGQADRQMCIAALFDMDWIEDSANRVVALGFIDRAMQDSVVLDVHDTSIYAEAHCMFYQGKNKLLLNIVLRFEEVSRGIFQWSIVGVNGLMETGLVDTSFYGTLSPIQHELGFMRLGKAFPEMYGFTQGGGHIDQLSYLMALSSVGKVKFGMCTGITYHCFAVPDYLFVIEQENRNTANSGWLIKTVYPAGVELKQQYLAELIGRTIKSVEVYE